MIVVEPVCAEQMDRWDRLPEDFLILPDEEGEDILHPVYAEAITPDTGHREPVVAGHAEDVAVPIYPYHRFLRLVVFQAEDEERLTFRAPETLFCERCEAMSDLGLHDECFCHYVCPGDHELLMDCVGLMNGGLLYEMTDEE